MKVDEERGAQFFSGESPIGEDPFWTLNLPKLKPGGEMHYGKFVDVLTPLRHSVGGKPILESDTASTAMDGDGAAAIEDLAVIAIKTSCAHGRAFNFDGSTDSAPADSVIVPNVSKTREQLMSILLDRNHPGRFMADPWLANGPAEFLTPTDNPTGRHAQERKP